MNIIDTSQISDPNVQQPFLGTSLAFLQNSTKEAISNTIIGLIGSSYSTSQVYILFGCGRTGAADTGIGTTTVAAGAIFYNGEVYTVPLQTVTLASNYLIGALLITAGSPDPVLFSDGSSKSVHNVRQWAMSAGASSAANYANWIPYTGAWTYIAGGIGYQNSWVDYGSGYNLGRFKIEGNKVRLGGVIVTGSSGTTAFSLPPGYRPLNQININTSNVVRTTALNTIMISTNGDVNVFWATNGSVSLDSVSFPLD